jgi:hypothetical protein
MPTPDPAGATGLAGAADAFEGLLTPASERTRSPKSNAASETAEASDDTLGDENTPEDDTVEEADPSDDASGDTEEGTEEGADAAGADEDTAAAEDAKGEPQKAKPPATVTVKVDGKAQEVSLDEVVRGYQRHADYSQKTQVLAEERRLIAQEAEQLVQERQQYAALLPALQRQLEALQEKEPNWEELYARDPLEYVRQKELYRDRQDRITAAMTERERLDHIEAQQRQQGLARTVAQGRQVLVNEVPEWKDPKRWEADRVRMLKFGQSIGFTEQELSQTYDPRAVIALHKAMKYDALMANRPRPVVKANGPRVSAAGSAESVPRPQDRTSQAKKRLSQTGNIKDAARVFEGIL